MAHKKKAWGPHPSQKGSETRRAKEHGRSLHEQAEVDEHSPDKRIRGKGIFALNAQRGAFKHPGKKLKKRSLGKRKTRKAVKGSKRMARKKA